MGNKLSVDFIDLSSSPDRLHLVPPCALRSFVLDEYSSSIQVFDGQVSGQKTALPGCTDWPS